MKKAIFLLVALVVVPPSFGQQFHLNLEGMRLQGNTVEDEATFQKANKPDRLVRNLTLELMQSEEGTKALRDFHALRKSGATPSFSKSTPSPIGTVRTFLVRNDKTGIVDTIEFTKKAESPVANLWVETAELLNGNVRDEDIARTIDLSSNLTPQGSVNTGTGAVQNNLDIFGAAPDVDGDGILDILLLDVRDTYPDVSSAILGFFSPANLTGQNLADIIFLDTFPGLIDKDGNRGTWDEPGHTLAHEHQHLIWSNVNSFGDITFINEGQAEWAEVINGFPARFTTYFQSNIERSQPLLGWRAGAASLNDYQRAGLFTNYISERIGVTETGSITRSLGVAADNYNLVLGANGLTLAEVVLDFHTANLLNDRSIDPKFGYTVPQYSIVKVQTVPEIDGLSTSSTPPTGGSLRPGAVFYNRWNDVANMQIDIAGDATKFKGRFLLESFTGEYAMEDLDQGGEGNFFSGDYASITLVLTTVNLNSLTTTPFSYSAAWQGASPNVTIEETIYDDGRVQSILFTNNPVPRTANVFPLGNTNRMANRFEVPAFSTLNAVRVDHIYTAEDPSSTLPPNQPRNFTLHIWGEDAEAEPGVELFSLEVNDTSPAAFFTEFDFFTVSLSDFASQLSNLPAVIFIGISDAGADENFINFNVSNFPSGTSPSYLFDDQFTGNQWAPFSGITFGDVGTFARSVLPIRASFLVQSGPVAVDDAAELPSRITLQQNYPNPFNPATTIAFLLPDASNVKLVVYDMLGRQIKTVVDEFRSVGAHEITFDASDLASGLYLYSLETGGQKVTRTMTLLK